MAGNARYTAVLDACVLYPLAIADSLVSLAVNGLFAAKWTTKIEEEWIGALEKNRPDLVGKLESRRDSMRDAVPDWEIPEDAWTPLAGSLVLPDPNDVHVLAAAIAGHADCIFTKNHRDFPADVMAPYEIDVLDPDEFILNQWDLECLPVMAAFKGMRARRQKPTESVEDFAHAFEKNGLPATAQKIREAAALI